MRACGRSVVAFVAFNLSGCLAFGQAPGASGAHGVSGTVVPAATTPTVIPAATAAQPIYRIYMPDGQLKSHSIRVYVTGDILESQNPHLQLLRSHAVTKKEVKDAKLEEPGVVAPGQTWMETIDGQQVKVSGTLLLFDLSQIDFEYKAMVRVTPVVSWTEGGTKRVVVGSTEVNVGNIVTALLWTAAGLVVALAIIIVMAWKAGGPLLLLTGVDGHLSLSQTQIACWTVAIGGIVLVYGLIRLDIPDIPSSLLVLMGASLATGGIGFFQDSQKQQTAVNAGVVPDKRELALDDLIRVFPTTGEAQLSLSKAQMIFWTALLLVLFVSKSILDGGIWDVPWPLVALMGFSQAGYLAPKLTPQGSTS